MRILLVDSDHDALMKSADALRRQYPSAEFISTTDAMEAVRYSLNNPVDAVYTEVLMPRLSGLDVIRLVRKFHPNAKAYILSDTDEFADWAKERGVGEHLLKHSVWARENEGAKRRYVLGTRKTGRKKHIDTAKRFEARELDERALSHVTGADGYNSGCPKCGCEGYSKVMIEVNGERALRRKCDNCGNVYG